MSGNSRESVELYERVRDNAVRNGIGKILSRGVAIVCESGVMALLKRCAEFISMVPPSHRPRAEPQEEIPIVDSHQELTRLLANMALREFANEKASV